MISRTIVIIVVINKKIAFIVDNTAENAQNIKEISIVNNLLSNTLIG